MRWTRREFLTRTSSGLAIASLSPWSVSREGPRLRVGLVGLGSHGIRHVAAGLLANVDIVRLCDVSPRALRQGVQCGEAWLRRTIATSQMTDEILHDPAIDAVVVAVPLRERTRLATIALEAGKHVYCEPPWATTIEESAAIVRTAARRGRLIWQGSHELAWSSPVVSDFFRPLTARAVTDIVVTRRVAPSPGEKTDPWDRPWLDALSSLADVVPVVPARRARVRVGTPFGDQGEITFAAQSESRQRIMLRELAGVGSEVVQEWHFQTGTPERSSSLWLAMRTTEVSEPDATIDLAGWQSFLRCVETSDGRAWAQAADRAHRTVAWFHDMHAAMM